MLKEIEDADKYIQPGTGHPAQLGDDLIRQYSLEVKALQEKLDTTIEKVTRDSISVFGIFASIVTFLAVQVGAFNNITRVSLLMGVSSFFLAAIMTFVLLLREVVNGNDKWSSLKKPLFILVGIFLAISMACFVYAVSTKS